MCECINKFIELTLNILNGILAIMALALLGYSAYMEIDTSSIFSEVMLGLSGFILISALIGFISVRTRSHFLLTVYGISMATLFLASVIMLILTYTSFSELISNIDRKKSKNFVKNHKKYIQYLLMALVAMQLFGTIFAFQFRGSGGKEGFENGDSYNGRDRSPSPVDKYRPVGEEGESTGCFGRKKRKKNRDDMSLDDRAAFEDGEERERPKTRREKLRDKYGYSDRYAGEGLDSDESDDEVLEGMRDTTQAHGGIGGPSYRQDRDRGERPRTIYADNMQDKLLGIDSLKKMDMDDLDTDSD